MYMSYTAAGETCRDTEFGHRVCLRARLRAWGNSERVGERERAHAFVDLPHSLALTAIGSHWDTPPGAKANHFQSLLRSFLQIRVLAVHDDYRVCVFLSVLGICVTVSLRPRLQYKGWGLLVQNLISLRCAAL
jgi:hypothetical protein